MNDPLAPAARATILVVDDVPDNLGVLGDLLRSQGYRVKVANAGVVALRYALQEPQPELILLDVMMPGMDGYEVLRRLRAEGRTRDIPVMFLTALGDPRDEEVGLALGAADYITKPIQASIVLARVRTQLEAKRARDWLADQNAALEAEVARRMEENELIQQVSIRALAHLAETRDPETGNHILRTQAYVRLLALTLRTAPRFAAQLSDHTVELLARSAPLHDIGKVGIPDHILLKPGKLTPDEWTVMKTHAAIGASAIEHAELDINRQVEFLTLAKQIARWHHERWDGQGYPDGLRGEAIPLAARLMAVADVYDALISPRVYKAPMAYDEARALIVAGRGTQFDPDVVDAFVACEQGFIGIAMAYSDVAAAQAA